MKRMKGEMQIGDFHIEWEDEDEHNDHLVVSHAGIHRRVRVCGGDLETVLDTLFVDTEEME